MEWQAEMKKNAFIIKQWEQNASQVQKSKQV